MKMQDCLTKCSIGFSYGMSFPLTLVILDYWLKDIGASNSVIGIFTLLHWPFTFKFLWGTFVENLDIPYLSKKTSRNKSWLIFSHLLLVIGIIGMAYSTTNTSLCCMITSASIVAIADGCKNVILYPYQISGVKKENLGYVASLVSLGHRGGMIFIKVVILHIAHFQDWKAAYLTAAVLIFLSMILILFMDEQPASKSKDTDVDNGIFIRIKSSFCNAVIVPFKALVTKKDGLNILAILVLYKSADFMIQKMSQPFLIEIGFTKLEIANIVQFLGSIAVIIGVFIGGYFIKKSGTVKAMIYLGCFHALSFFSYLLLIKLGHNVLALGIIVLLGAITGGSVTAAFLAFLYSLCKTGAYYALLWAFHEMGGMFFMTISGALVDYIGWTWYFALVPLIFFPNVILLKRTESH